MLFISIHAPTRGATNITSAYVTTTKFQSTLPQEERLDTIFGVLRAIKISIHAPTRGATAEESDNISQTTISIHAPTRGATAILHKKFVYFYTIPTINI